MRNRMLISERFKDGQREAKNPRWWWGVGQDRLPTAVECWATLTTMREVHKGLFPGLLTYTGLRIVIEGDEEDVVRCAVEVAALELGDGPETTFVAYRLRDGEGGWILGMLDDAVLLAEATRTELRSLREEG